MCAVLMGNDIFSVLYDHSLVSLSLLLDESPHGWSSWRKVSFLLTSALEQKREKKICVCSGKSPLFYSYLWHDNQYNNSQVPSS